MTVETGYEAKPCLAVLHPPLAVRPVPQRSQYDCGVAAMAMLFDLSYEEAEGSLPFRCGEEHPNGTGIVGGISPVDILWVGLRRDVPVALIAPQETFVESWGDIGRCITAPPNDALWTWLEGRRAAFSVRSMTNPSGLHCVVWDGRYLIDPLYKRHRARHYQVMDRPTILDAVVRLDSVVS